MVTSKRGSSISGTVCGVGLGTPTPLYINKQPPRPKPLTPLSVLAEPGGHFHLPLFPLITLQYKSILISSTNKNAYSTIVGFKNTRTVLFKVFKQHLYFKTSSQASQSDLPPALIYINHSSSPKWSSHYLSKRRV